MFLFIILAAMETLEAVWSERYIEAPSFGWNTDSDDSSINGTITGQITHRTGTIFDLSARYMRIMAHSCSLVAGTK